MEANLIMEGVKFMFLGMGTVFVFLIIMIFSVNLMSLIIHKFFPEPQAAEETVSGNATQQQQDKKKIIAAITAAIAHHKQG
ncbi:OadG family protein [Sulfurimonas sp. SWIR-19]|uniref:OadG family protein n=1 Tax=Sulfurimonas sp. SWIR-19 TaxID=2878390 RepID=UPI001CF34C50|nr:OadG family transporter subunit [Sulfurimonas sp. SWIR-19]UCN01228.1 OadG family protein [Sulfurimonas sp. SWIR-19]